MKTLKETVDRVIVVGLGYAFDKLELETIASKPTNKNFIEVQNSANLEQRVKDVTRAICETEVRYFVKAFIYVLFCKPFVYLTLITKA